MFTNFRNIAAEVLSYEIRSTPLTKIKNKVSHAEYFNAVANYLRQTYGLEADKSGKDVSRSCFLPYDPEAYINPKNL